MKLYYAPGACSLASHIVLRESAAPFALVRVDLARHRVEDDDRDFYTLTAKGQVPLLETADGVLISEGPVVMQHIADTQRADELLPPAGTLARLRVLEWCNHLTSEIHKSFTPLFHRHVDAAATQTLKGLLKKKLAFLDEQLADKRHLTGDPFTMADAYLFVLLGWCKPVQLDIADLARLQGFQARVAKRPAVQAAMKAEGLLD